MKLKVILLALVACVLWGSAFSTAKLAFEFMPPILLSGFRFMLAGLLLVPFLKYQKVDIIAQVRTHWRFMCLFALIQTFLQYGLFYMGLSRVAGATSAIIIGAGPMLTMFMAHFLMPDDKITLRKLVSLCVAMIGLVFIVLTRGGQSVQSDEVFFWGVLLLVISNTVGSYTNIMVAKYNKPLSPILLTSYANAFGGLLLLGFGFLLEDMPLADTLTSGFYLTMLWLALIPAAGFSIWYTLLQRPDVKVSDLNMFKFMITVAGCVLSWIFLPGEVPTLSALLGIVLIALSLWFYRR